jgi:molecular chaperone DnaK
MGGIYDTIIEANSTVPTKKSKVYSTAADNQPSVEIHVLQGERKMAKDNRTVGRFILDGIPPAPRGVPQIEVSFDIDANGMINVSAKDKGTGKEQSIRIEASTGLSEEEIAQMKADAEKNAEADAKAKERVEKVNAADSLIFQTEKQMKEFGDKIPEDKKGAINEALAGLKEAHSSEDLDKIDDATQKLNDAWSAASQEIYQAQQEAGATPGSDAGADSSNGQASGDDDQEDVTDVEFEEVDGDNK